MIKLDEYPNIETSEIGLKTRRRLVGRDVCREIDASDMLMAGVVEVVDDYRFARIRPTFGQVLVTLDGVGECLIDGRWERCNPGQAYITPAIAHSAYRRIPEQMWKFAWVHLKSPLVPFEKPKLRITQIHPFFVAIEGLLVESYGLGLPAANLCWIRLIEIAAKRIQGLSRSAGPIADVWGKVTEDLVRPWSLDEIAAMANMSPGQFRRRCDEIYRRTPREHLAILRMRRAADLLTTIDAKLEVIAAHVGYTDVFAFSVAFKRTMGRAPSEYRKPPSQYRT